MLSNKAGLVHIHVGAGPSGLQPLRDALAVSDVPIRQFLPTHIDRNAALVAEGAAWLQDGGCIDLTAGDEVLKISSPLQSAIVDTMHAIMG